MESCGFLSEQHFSLKYFLKNTVTKGEEWVNPLMLIEAKKSPTILIIFWRQKQSQENIWWRNTNQNITYNSNSYIL